MTERVCSMDGCDRPHKAHGFCKMHYRRYKNNGDPSVLGVQRYQSAECSVPGCTTDRSAGAMCVRHTARWYQTGRLWSDPPIYLRCAVCDNPNRPEDPGGPAQTAAVGMGVSAKVLRRHRSHSGEWHAKRAAWWVRELGTLRATVEADGG